MQQILVYADSLSWGIVPGTRQRHPFDIRWPGVLEQKLNAQGRRVRVIEDCLNGRRTAWEDPYKPGRNGLQGLEQRIEIHSPLALVILMLGTRHDRNLPSHRSPRTPIGAVDIRHISLTQVLHHLRCSLPRFRYHQEVDVVGHQHVGVKIDRLPLASLTERIKVERVILFREETGPPVVTPLDEAHRNSRELEP